MKYEAVIYIPRKNGRPPHGGRGLKSLMLPAGDLRRKVAPRTGGVD